ncbi:MAG TPA: hypothetical protein VFF73_36425 [Planctomycetota bacterium]|nr:hypothetical protein [Planctomycetota bacterium]
MRSSALFLVLALAACTARRPPSLDYAPAGESRETWRFSFDHEARYDGHDLLRRADGSIEWVQTAGDFQTRARTFSPPGGEGPRVDLVTVWTLGTRSYYDALARELEGADLVVAATRVKKDASQIPLGEGYVTGLHRLADLFPPLVSFLDADGIAWRGSFASVPLTTEDLAVLEGERSLMAKGVEETRARVERIKDGHDADLALHELILNGFVAGDGQFSEKDVRLRPGESVPDPRFDVTETLASRTAEAARATTPESRQAAIFDAFLAHRLPELCLAMIANAPHARKIVVLAPGRTSEGLGARLRARGWRVVRESWWTAIPLLSGHAGH